MRGLVDADFRIWAPFRVLYGDKREQLLLPAQASSRVGAPDSEQSILYLLRKLFSKSEIEFLVSPDPIPYYNSIG